MRLNFYATYPPRREMVIMGCSSEACLSQAGRLTVADCLRIGPLPHGVCLPPPCRCVFQPIPASLLWTFGA
ncbi:hypothetical protein ACVWYS_003113 [Arthrobacter sp. TE12231]